MSGGSRAAEMPPGTRRRLRRSVERFPSADGDLYLMGAGGDRVLRAASPTDAAVLDELAGAAHDARSLSAALAARGLPLGEADGAERLASLDAAGLLAPEPARSELSDDERERFDRQLIYLEGLGVDAHAAQARLRRARVLVLGCGGLGSCAAATLAGAGVGGLVLVDDDRVELSNLSRQALFARADVGRLKVDAASDALRRLAPDLELRTHARRVRGVEDVMAVAAGADLVIETADWPPHQLPRWVNAACARTGTPHLSAGQAPPLVRVGPFVVPGETACLECQEADVRRRFPLYDELARHRMREPAVAATMAPTSAAIGAIIAMEALHHLTGTAPPATRGRVLLLDLRTLESRLEEVTAERDCPVCAT
jgi:molybdopterin-synthase adenylyltransferase